MENYQERSYSSSNGKMFRHWTGGQKTEEKASKQELPSQSLVNQESEMIGSQSHLIAGISDLGSAFNPSPTAASQENLENLEVPVNPDLAQPKKTTRKLKNQVIDSKTPQQQEPEQPEVTVEVTEVWRPDLAGWDVSYGLPK